MESSVNTLLQTLKDNLNSDELVGLDKENYPCLYPESKQAKNNKGNRCWECMPCCYWGLFIFFNQRCIDALVKSTRQSLDAIKRRMQAASKHSKESLDADNKSPALFKVSAYSTRRIFLHIVCKRLLSFAPSARLHLLFVLIASNDLFFLCTFPCLLFSFFLRLRLCSFYSVILSFPSLFFFTITERFLARWLVESCGRYEYMTWWWRKFFVSSLRTRFSEKFVFVIKWWRVKLLRFGQNTSEIIP